MKLFKKHFKSNKTRLIFLVLCLLTSLSQAAPPPDFQNEKDLADIVSYIKSDHEVLTRLPMNKPMSWQRVVTVILSAQTASRFG